MDVGGGKDEENDDGSALGSGSGANGEVGRCSGNGDTGRNGDTGGIKNFIRFAVDGAEMENSYTVSISFVL